MTHLGQKQITIDATTPNERYYLEYFVSLVCAEKGIETREFYIKTRCRKRIYVESRFMIFNLLRQRNWSLKSIARIFGHHHTSVLTGLKKHVNYRKHDHVYRHEFERVLIKLEQ